MKSDRNNQSVRLAAECDQTALMSLWQDCFHDTDAFTNYYFDTYFRENKVLLLEENEQLKSMLHLNPYTFRMKGQSVGSWYIVGVATDADYRHRGAMTRLLRATFEKAYGAHMPFVYLMPADEAIYRPSQFAYIYAQQVVKQQAAGAIGASDEVEAAGVTEAADMTAYGLVRASEWVGDRRDLFREESAFSDKWLFVHPAASEADYTAIAAMANEKLAADYELYTIRDVHFLKRLQQENQVDGGNLLVFEDGDRIVGYCAYAQESAFEIREIYGMPEYEKSVVKWFLENFTGKAGEILPLDTKNHWFSSGEKAMRTFEKRPIIMGRIVDLKVWMQLLSYNSSRDTVAFSLVMAVSDDWILANNGCFEWQASADGCTFEATDKAPDIRLSIDSLMQWTSGYETPLSLINHDKISLETDCVSLLQKIPVLDGIFINEIV